MEIYSVNKVESHVWMMLKPLEYKRFSVFSLLFLLLLRFFKSWQKTHLVPRRISWFCKYQEKLDVILTQFWRYEYQKTKLFIWFISIRFLLPRKCISKACRLITAPCYKSIYIFKSYSADQSRYSHWDKVLYVGYVGNLMHNRFAFLKVLFWFFLLSRHS